jgi:hypothetical protein
MIVDYDKETDTVYISKQIDNWWIQVGLNRDEVNQIIRSRPYNPQAERVIEEPIDDQAPVPEQEVTSKEYAVKCNKCLGWGTVRIDTIGMNIIVHNEQSIRQDEREKVLDDVWRKWSEHNYTKSLWDILQELRQEGKVE